MKTSETQLKRCQDELDLLQHHISGLQSKILRFGTLIAAAAPAGIPTGGGSSSLVTAAASLDEMRHQLTQLNVQITKAAGKKKQKLFESANKLKQQIQAEEKRQQHAQDNISGGVDNQWTSEGNDQWVENDMTLPQLESELRSLQSQLPEAESKVRRGQSRFPSSLT